MIAMLAGGSAVDAGVCRATTMSMPAGTGQREQAVRATPKQMRKSKAGQAGILTRSNVGGNEGGPRSAITACSSAKTATIMTTRPGVERGNRTIVAGGGKAGSSAGAKHENVGGFVDGIEMYLGLIGWRKKCLYTLLLLLTVLIITNLVLTLWILKVMEFSTVRTVAVHLQSTDH